MSRFLSLSFSLFLPFSILLSHPGPFFCAFPKFQSFITGWLVCLYLFSCPRMALKTMQCHIYLDWEFPILDSHVTWNTLWKCQILGGDGLVAPLSPTLAAPWTGVNQGSLSMGFSRQEYWSGLPCPPQGRSSCIQFSRYFFDQVKAVCCFLFWRIFSSILFWQFCLSTLRIYHPTFSWPTRFLLRNILRSKWRLLSKFQVRK